MTYILREDQAAKLRQNRARTGKSAVRQIAEAVKRYGGSEEVAGMAENSETSDSCHFVRFSIEERIPGIGSAALRRILDLYFRDQDRAAEARKKPDYAKEIADLDKQINELWEVTITQRKRAIYKLAGGMV